MQIMLEVAMAKEGPRIGLLSGDGGVLGKDRGWDLGHLWGDLSLPDTYCLLVFMLFYGPL